MLAAALVGEIWLDDQLRASEGCAKPAGTTGELLELLPGDDADKLLILRGEKSLELRVLPGLKGGGSPESGLAGGGAMPLPE